MLDIFQRNAAPAENVLALFTKYSNYKGKVAADHCTKKYTFNSVCGEVQLLALGIQYLRKDKKENRQFQKFEGPGLNGPPHDMYFSDVSKI